MAQHAEGNSAKSITQGSNPRNVSFILLHTLDAQRRNMAQHAKRQLRQKAHSGFKPF